MLSFNNYSSDKVKAKVDLYNGSTLVQSCKCSNFLENFTISRVGVSDKFFGFGVCHAVDINFIDLENNLNVEKGYTAKIELGDGDTYWNSPYPTFYLVEVNKDEKNSSITATAYDDLYRTSEHTWKEVVEVLAADSSITAPYSLLEISKAICTVMGWPTNVSTGLCQSRFNVRFDSINYEGTELLRDVLDDIAEVTQTIYFLNSSSCLQFVALRTDHVARPITKDDYYELNTLTPRTITGIGSATELGENYEKNPGEGVTQFIRNNPFWELQPNVPDLVEAALRNVSGITITQFDCDWDGDYRLEIGDRIALQTDDGELLFTYVLNDTISYDGALSEFTEWEFTDNDSETLANPTDIKEALNATYARVDKINKDITLYVGEVVNEVLPTKIEEVLDGVVEGLVGDAIDGVTEGLYSDIEDLKAVTKTHTENITTLTLNAEAINLEISGLQQSTTEIANDVSELEVSQESLQKDVSGIKVTSNAINSEVSSLKTQTTTLSDAVVGLAGVISTTQNNVSALSVTTDGIAANVSNLSSTVQNVEKNVTSNANEITTIKSNQTKTDNKVASLTTSVDGIIGRVEDLEESTDSTITETVNTLNGEISSIKTEQTTMKNDIAALKVKDTEITASVNGVQSTTTTLTSSLNGVISKQTTMESDISQLKLDKDGINASVSSLEETITEGLNSASEQINSLQNQVGLAITSKDVSIQISEALVNGVDRIETTTGYTFDDEGLHISKTGTAMESTLDEEGLVVSRSGTPILEAVSDGVNALNITVRQYLKIGGSRFQKYGTNRTGCYWIGE